MLSRCNKLARNRKVGRNSDCCKLRKCVGWVLRFPCLLRGVLNLEVMTSRFFHAAIFVWDLA